jgi:uncharacterized protein HemX
MFQIVSNPFVEMTQGVVSNGLGYIAEKSKKSDSFVWLWWIAGAILTAVGFFLFTNHQKKKEAEKLKLEEEQKKLAETKKEITPI